jgi:O-antigen/teichoic acid export membrane protein
VALGISVALAATVGILGSSILQVWIGDDYSRYGYLVAILAAAAVVDTVAWPAAAILTGTGRHRPLAWMALGGAAAKVALALIAVVPFGLTGVAVATLTAACAETALLVTPYALRTVELGASTFVTKVILPNVVPTAAIILPLLIARVMLDTDRLGVLLGAISVALTAYAAAYLAFSAGVVEKQFYRHLGESSWSVLTRTARN